MMMEFRKFTIPCILLLLISACATQTQFDSSRNLAYLYNPSLTSLHPRFQVFHEGDQHSILSVKVYPVELLFNQANETGNYQAQLEVYFRLYEINGIRSLVDSGVYRYPIDMRNVRREFVANIPLKAVTTNKYNLEVIANDVNRNKAVQRFIPIDKSTRYNAQNFQVLRSGSESMIFNPILDSTQVVNVRYPREDIDSLYLHYYRNENQVPYPPSLLIPSRTFRQTPDTIIALPYGDSLPIHLKQEGIYHFTVDRGLKEGCSLFYFGEHFPSVKRATQMIDPLEYLLSESDMRKLRSDPNPKIAVDKFWLNISSDIEQARELIRIYYNRVFYANYFFVSYKEGWETDRGMIYIIYGPPDVLYKNDQEERWIYGKEKTPEKIIFTFTKADNPFTPNDYRLRRSDGMNTRWGEAIGSWKRGIVFTIDEIYSGS